MRKTPKRVAMNIPMQTVTPMTFRASAMAPEANIRGATPRIKANAVMRMGRRRSLAASIAASTAPMPDSRCDLANSTMRMAFLAARPMSVIMPIWAKTLFTKLPPMTCGRIVRRVQRPAMAPKSAKGVPSRTLKGKDQLSYCAARMKKTTTSAKRKTIDPVPDAFFSW